ncbi:MAG: very short patch repair endonuclease [Formivibrio sp.]|nr:very short patch repair endonuclease [Formivibrio sp.]
MTDVVDPATRSRMMSGIRSKNTKPEMLIRKALHAQGFRFRLHVKDLPGKPDLVFPKYKAVIFVHGCFWHGHDCRYFKLPQTRTCFWKTKIQKNQDRDRTAIELLKNAGWRIAIVWECALKSPRQKSLNDVATILADWLDTNQIDIVID